MVSLETPFEHFIDNPLAITRLQSGLTNQLKECCSLYLLHYLLETSIIPITGNALRYYQLDEADKAFLDKLVNHTSNINFKRFSSKLNLLDVMLINDIQVLDNGKYIINYS